MVYLAQDPAMERRVIVKLVEGSLTALTATGGLVDTPADMSPERAMAQLELDGHSDI